MIRSMTGYGEARVSIPVGTVRATVRALNLKQLDVRVNLPGYAISLESEVVERVRAEVRRGRVEVRLDIDSSGSRSRDVVSPELESLAADLRRAATALRIPGELTIGDLLAAGAGSLLRAEVEPTVDEVHRGVLDALDEALQAFEVFRIREGSGLAALYHEALGELATLFDEIERLAADVTRGARARLRARVADLLADQDAGRLDTDRVELEVVLIAERSDIAEEIQRARAHLTAIEEAITEPGPHGKRLDFLLQELVRETNTMASKSSSATLTHRVVDAKTRVDQLREQAQNIE